MSVRLAVIGAGIMGADHARIVAEDLPGATLQAVCDASEDRARAVADTTGAADWDTDPMAVIARRDVDALIVASPDATHAGLVLAAIERGKPVLCEKPLAPTVEDCLEVTTAEAAAGRPLVQLGFMRRFDQSYVEMKAALDAGTLGRALMMHNLHRNVASPNTDFTGAMAILNSAPHEFDVARHVLGTEFTTVTAAQPRRSDDYVAPVVMVLETEAGQLVTIEVNNNAAYGYDIRGELVGEAASVSLVAPLHSRLDAGLRNISEYAADWRPRYAEAYRRQNRAFVRFVQTGRLSDIAADAWDGYAAAAVAAAAVRALGEGRKVAVELAPRPDFYDRGSRP